MFQPIRAENSPGHDVQNCDRAEQCSLMTGGVRWRKFGIFISSALACLLGTTWDLVWVTPCLTGRGTTVNQSEISMFCVNQSESSITCRVECSCCWPHVSPPLIRRHLVTPNQSEISKDCVNQSEISIFSVPTNQRLVEYCVNQSEMSITWLVVDH